MKTQKGHSGVTLVELVIAISVVAILIGLSAPAYSEFVTKRKVAGAANLVGTFFESIKMESIKRNEFATISYKNESGGAAWCLGAVMGKDTPCDCMAETTQCLIDSVPTILSNQTYADFNEVQTNFSDGSITFDPIRGILLDPADSVLMEITHVKENIRVDVSVNATGSVRKCTPANHNLVGYATCA